MSPGSDPPWEQDSPYWSEIVRDNWPQIPPSYWAGLATAAHNGAAGIDPRSAVAAARTFDATVRSSARLQPVKDAVSTLQNAPQTFVEALTAAGEAFGTLEGLAYRTRHRILDVVDEAFGRIGDYEQRNRDEKHDQNEQNDQVGQIIQRAQAQVKKIAQEAANAVNPQNLPELSLIAELFGMPNPWTNQSTQPSHPGQNSPGSGLGPGHGSSGSHNASHHGSAPGLSNGGVRGQPESILDWLDHDRNLWSRLLFGQNPPQFQPWQHQPGSEFGPDAAASGTPAHMVAGASSVALPADLAAAGASGDGTSDVAVPAPAADGLSDAGGAADAADSSGGVDPAQASGASVSTPDASVPDSSGPEAGSGAGLFSTADPMPAVGSPPEFDSQLPGLGRFHAMEPSDSDGDAPRDGDAEPAGIGGPMDPGDEPSALPEPAPTLVLPQPVVPLPQAAAPRRHASVPGGIAPAGVTAPGGSTPPPHQPPPLREAVVAAMAAATAPSFVVGDKVNGDLMVARTVLTAVLVATQDVLGVDWAVSVLRGPGGLTVFLTSNEGRGWLPAGLYLPREVSIPWIWDESTKAAGLAWEGLADPARVLVEFGVLWGRATGARLSALVTSIVVDDRLRAALPAAAMETVAVAGAESALDLGAPGPGLVDRLGVVGSPELLNRLAGADDSSLRERCLELAVAAHTRGGSPPGETADARAARTRILTELRAGRAVPDERWDELRDADDLLAALVGSRRVDASRVDIGGLRADPAAVGLRRLVFERRRDELVLLLRAEPSRLLLRDAVYAYGQLVDHPDAEAAPTARRPTVTAPDDSGRVGRH